MPDKNSESVLFLYEGATEIEFYSKIFKKYLPRRKIMIDHSNLGGVHNLNQKVKRKILRYLAKKKEANSIHVIIAHDREGRRYKKSALNLELLLSDEEIMITGRVTNIREIIATQDIESWFFKDIEGIYRFLKVPKSKRSNKYKNSEAWNNRDLSKLFHRFNRHYQKGSRVEGFVSKLDLEKIYNKTPELTEIIAYIKNLISD